MVHSKKKGPKLKLSVKEKLLQRKKHSRELLKEKRARLIVKNLPFKATEENLRQYFEQYGDIVSVDLLKKPDGKLVGCGFIQFKLVQKAAKAKHHTNGKQFMGRQIAVEFAKAKDKFKKEGIKTEDENKDPSTDIKDELTHVIEGSDITEMKTNDEESEDLGEDDSFVRKSNKQTNYRMDKAPPHVISNDVSEGKTVFVKNVPFEATNDDLRNCLSQFGRIYYALICIDKFTEHSKGTAFVKFVNKEDAEKALNAGTELTLLGNILDCHPALDRKEIQKKAEEKKNKEPKDSRNLYLVKEGVILAGSKAAEGVSATDMAKRLQIEQYKTQMLRNLNMFVSKDRLVVHNLPASWDDKKLKTLFKKFGGPDSVVKEARIMRDMKNIDVNGLGKSKEYGFVSFTTHEHALAALRNLNNNPNVFSSNRRPIITFSIENKKMINAKLKRLEKSMLNNSTKKKDQSETLPNKGIKKTERGKNLKTQSKTKYKSMLNNSGKKKEETETLLNKKSKGGRERRSLKTNDKASSEQPFSGVATKPGTLQKMRSRYKLNTQATLHYQNLKKERMKKKHMKKTLNEKKQDFIKQPKQKINKKNKEHDNFAKLVSDYKKKIVSAGVSEKSKWYE